MFYVGALLIASGRYDFAKMLQVFSLIIFSVTFSAQILSYRESPQSSLATTWPGLTLGVWFR
jgi:ATP-binding cassette subfamily B (MDR/TAP) protein 1